jgi:glutamyl-tRNA reductase
VPMSASPPSAAPAASAFSTSIAGAVGVATGLLTHTPVRQVMTSIDTPGSQISESEISETLASLRKHFESVRRGEIQHVRGRLGKLSPDQENAIDSLSHALIERVLQAPMAMLKNACTGNQVVFLLATVRRIFNL